MGRDYLAADYAERKEIWYLLEKLTPRERVRFVQECCRSVKEDLVGVQVTHSTGRVDECFLDLSMLAYQYGLDLERVALRLTKYMK